MASSANAARTADAFDPSTPTATTMPTPTFLDEFGYHLAARLLGRECVAGRLERSRSAAFSSSSSSSQPASFRLYWRTPLLTTVSELMAEGDDRPHDAPDVSAAFVDLTFDFVAPADHRHPRQQQHYQLDGKQSAASAASEEEVPSPPRVEVRLGSLLRRWHPISASPATGEIDRSRRGDGATYLRNRAPLSTGELRRHGEEVGVYLDEMEAGPTAGLMAAALQLTSEQGGASRASSTNGTDGDERGSSRKRCLRAEARTKSGGDDGGAHVGRTKSASAPGDRDGDGNRSEEVTVRLYHPDLREEGTLLVVGGSGVDDDEHGNRIRSEDEKERHVGEMALRMLLANLENEIRATSGDRANADASADNTAGVDGAFDQWWKCAVERQQQMQQRQQLREVQTGRSDLYQGVGSDGGNDRFPRRRQGGRDDGTMPRGGVGSDGVDVADEEKNDKENCRRRDEGARELGAAAASPPPSAPAGRDGEGSSSSNDLGLGPRGSSASARSAAATAVAASSASPAAESNSGSVGRHERRNERGDAPPLPSMESSKAPNISALPSQQQQQQQQQQRKPAPAADGEADPTAAAAVGGGITAKARSGKRPVHGHVLVRGGGGTKRKKRRGKVTIGRVA